MSSIIVHAVCASATSPATTYSKVAIYISGGAYYGTENVMTSTEFTDYEKEWTTNPATGTAWTWSNLDSLEIGVALKSDGGNWACCTQVYVVIDYTVSTGGPIGGPGVGPMMIF